MDFIRVVMTDTETANEIGERIGPKVLPIDPLEFQRMIHDDNSIKEPKGLMGKLMNMLLRVMGLNFLMEDYCSCNLEKACAWNSDVWTAAEKTILSG